MHKDWMFWLVAVMLFVEGAIWARLMGPFPELREINMATVAAWVAAGGTVATAVIAYKAAGVWRMQLKEQHKLELLRRIAIQIGVCENAILEAVPAALLFLQSADNAKAGDQTYQRISTSVMERVEHWSKAHSELRGLAAEYRAWWGEPPPDVFRPIFDLFAWVNGCCRDFHTAVHRKEYTLVASISVKDAMASSFKQAKKLGIDVGADAVRKSDIDSFFRPTDTLITSKLRG